MAREKHPQLSSKENFWAAGQDLRGIAGRFFQPANYAAIAAYSPQALYELQSYGRLRMMHLYEGGKYRFGDGTATAPAISFAANTALGLSRPQTGYLAFSGTRFVAAAGFNFGFSHGTSALATSATDGFLHIQSCAGHPSGTPANIPSGQIPVVANTTDVVLEGYATAWREFTPLTKRLASDTSVIGGVTSLTDIAGLAVNVRAAGIYRIKIWFTWFTNAASTGGFKFALGGTATATDVNIEQVLVNTTSAAFLVYDRKTAIASGSGNSAWNGTNVGYITGCINVNAAGTITLKVCQNSADASYDVTIHKDSYTELIRLA